MELSDGSTYEIIPHAADHLRLDVRRYENADGAPLQLWTANLTYAQLFVAHEDFGTWRFSPKCAPTRSITGFHEVASDVILHENTPAEPATQFWRVRPLKDSDGCCIILCDTTGLALTIGMDDDHALEPATRVSLYYDYGGATQQFRLRLVASPLLVDGAVYEIHPKHVPALCLGVDIGGSSVVSQGTGVSLQAPKTNSTTQLFTANVRPSGSWSFSPLCAPTMCIDRTARDRKPCHLWPADENNTNQQFSLTTSDRASPPTAAGLRCKTSGLVLEVSCGSREVGSSIRTWDPHEAALHQQFVFRPMPLTHGAAYELIPRLARDLRVAVKVGDDKADGAKIALEVATQAEGQFFTALRSAVADTWSFAPMCAPRHRLVCSERSRQPCHLAKEDTRQDCQSFEPISVSRMPQMYILRSPSTGHVLGIGGAAGPGVSVISSRDNGSRAVQFRLKLVALPPLVAGGVYEICPRYNSEKRLTVLNSANRDNVEVIATDKGPLNQPSWAQLWRASSINDRSWRFEPLCAPHRALTVLGETCAIKKYEGSTANVTQSFFLVHSSEETSSDAPQLSTTYYEIRNDASGLVVSVPQGTTSEVAKVSIGRFAGNGLSNFSFIAHTLIDDAVYELSPRLAQNMRVEVQSFDTGKVALSPAAPKISQLFRVKQVCGTSCGWTIAPFHDSAKLILSAGGSGRQVRLVPRYASSSTTLGGYFEIVPVPRSPYFTIHSGRNGATTEVLDLFDPTAREGVPVMSWVNNGSLSQQFRFTLTMLQGIEHRGIYEIVPRVSPDLRVEVKGGRDANNTNLHLQPASGSLAQQYVCVARNYGSWSFAPLCAPGRSIDNCGEPKALVHLWLSDPFNQNQTFTLRLPTPDGFFVVRSQSTGLVLDCGSGKNGALLSTQDIGPTPSQQFRLVLRKAVERRVASLAGEARASHELGQASEDEEGSGDANFADHPPTEHALKPDIEHAGRQTSSYIRRTTRRAVGDVSIRVFCGGKEHIVDVPSVLHSAEELREVVIDFLIGEKSLTTSQIDDTTIDLMEQGKASPLGLVCRFREAYSSLTNRGGKAHLIVSSKECRIGKWTIEDELGSGSFGTVVKGIAVVDGFTFAAKVVSPQGYRAGVEGMRTEIRILQQLRHPNIVEYYGSCDNDDGGITIFMEILLGGTLASKVRSRFVNGEEIGGLILPTSTIQSYAKQLLLALDYLHGFGIVHRDIKPDNILLNETGMLKLVDFGLAKHLSTASGTVTARHGVCGTALYAAPEVFELGLPTPMCDIWSFGCTVVELLTNMRPFAELGPMNDFQLAHKVVNERRCPSWEKGVCLLLDDVLERCFVHAHEERATAADLLQHTFFSTNFS